MKLHVVGDPAPSYRARLHALALPADAPGDCLLLWDPQLDAALAKMEREDDLRWVHTRMAGVPDALLRACQHHDLILTNGSGAHGEAIAEYVVAMLLALCKRLPELFGHQRERFWWHGAYARELAGQTVGILGTGALGRACARLLRAFGTRLVGIRRTTGAVSEFDEVHTTADLASVLPRLDALVIAAPLTPATRGLIGRAELDLLEDHALLINVGRGPIVDERALTDALHRGRLAGAALDVFAHEPLPSDSPLWAAPRLILSPHCADNTPQTTQRELALFLDNVARWGRGEPLRNVVDARRGY